MDAHLKGMDESYYGFLYHYYRAEVYRETNWRNRLDVTTNWAIVTTAAILSFVFGNPETSHTTIIMNYAMVLFFLMIEARRFRYYSLLKSRTRQIEEQILAPLFSEGNIRATENKEWLKKLCNSLVEPRIPMSRRESIAWRLRRNYIFVLPTIFLAWMLKLYYLARASGQESFTATIAQGTVCGIPGEIIFVLFFGSLLFFTWIAVYLPEHSRFDDLP